ncbi:MAG TPA: hypothetical protein VF885_13395, partial [Arthrobacter sp.]
MTPGLFALAAASAAAAGLVYFLRERRTRSGPRSGPRTGPRDGPGLRDGAVREVAGVRYGDAVRCGTGRISREAVTAP